MKIKFKCKCGKVLSVDSSLAGKRGKCPVCQQVITIPSVSSFEEPGSHDTVDLTDAVKKIAEEEKREASHSQKTSHSVKKVYTVKCEDCGSIFENYEYKEGMKCPGCKSQNFHPISEAQEIHQPKKVIGEEVEAEGVGLKDWKRNPIVGIIAAIITIIVWSSMAYRALKGPERPKIWKICAKCNYLFKEEIKKEGWPNVCPKCGAKAVYQAMECNKCHNIFPYIPPSPPPVKMNCPKCGTPMEGGNDPYNTTLFCPKCNYTYTYASYYCYDCKNAWNVLPDENGKIQKPEKCPKCGSKNIIPTMMYTPYCPKCKSTDITSYRSPEEKKALEKKRRRLRRHK